ncbi:hypothetical protein C8P67_1452 [Flavobacterium aquicola]|uniref:Uncharacterized protein n=1 Tax=Flavobacterium aquicola TaxID=1682742 RepID=A0A3E0DVB6_9FLAO|nr:hypothetical protein C8P67_1452 [Flavobacterium aquicola]
MKNIIYLYKKYNLFIQKVQFIYTKSTIHLYKKYN